MNSNEPGINGIQLMFLVNRLQIGYTVLLLPTQLISGSNYWIIATAFFVSQLNLFLISKWLYNSKTPNDKQLQNLFPKIMLYPMVSIGLAILMLKFSIIIIGYSKVIQLYVLREDRLISIIIILIVVVAFSTYQGILNVSRFSVLAFLFSAWIILAYIEVLLSPNSIYRDFLPLVNGFEKGQDIKRFFYLLSSFSGPELLLLLKRWIKPEVNVYKYTTAGNFFTLLEYSLLFFIAVVFFGPDYLKKVEYPLVTIARYIQLPIIDRLEMIIIPFFMFPLILSLSLINLYLYSGIKFLFQFKENNLSYGLFVLFLALLLTFIQHEYWMERSQEFIWLNVYIYLTAIFYTAIPLLFYIIKRVKKI
ncbi:GerAB/ArcD/ProY family transporter [Bacillus sp. MRMR6]|uniref:GerAB/ArcD/ProY family transporter n=1 Tax=Bacillus sp. MRMR6 TaxID=1928617 RepID=UPI00158C88B8|nr:GerAB/ArcD/ProY family transporter [Bacillus sp. MRMR6]